LVLAATRTKLGLDDTVSDYPELENLRLKKEHWITLSNIKKVLKPFERYTQQVSKKAPSLHMSVKMYCTEPKVKHRRPAGKFWHGPGRSMLNPGTVIDDLPDPSINVTEYQRGVGSLQYLSDKTRPDIARTAGRRPVS
jgi:hypothetical protein